MKTRQTFPVSVAALFIVTNVFAADDRDERVLRAVTKIITVQHDSGEQGAIALLQSCYSSVPARVLSEKLEECISQDIAYSNFSTGFYKHVLKSMKQPDYPSFDAMKLRVFAAATSAGMSDREAETYLRQLAPVAMSSVGTAIQSLPATK